MTDPEMLTIDPDTVQVKRAAPAAKGHLIFGMNGTLLDTQWNLSKSVAQLARGKSYPVSIRTVFSLYAGLSPAQQFSEIGAQHGDCMPGKTLRQLCEDYEAEKANLYDSGPVSLLPGVPETLARLRGDGWVLSLCSNTPSAQARDVLAETKIAHFFDGRIYGPDSVGGAAKPDPAMIVRAVREQGLRAESTIMVGDSGADIVAAREAKVKMIAYLDPRFVVEPGGLYDADDGSARAAAMRRAGARRVIMSWEDLPGALNAVTAAPAKRPAIKSLSL